MQNKKAEAKDITKKGLELFVSFVLENIFLC